jgi:hypothetical protein
MLGAAWGLTLPHNDQVGAGVGVVGEGGWGGEAAQGDMLLCCLVAHPDQDK